jgi:hypothetical protein
MPQKLTPEVAAVFNSYPPMAREKLLDLRKLIFATAADLPNKPSIEETLKWGEPSYLTQEGSTIRIAWKAKSPNQYAMYLNCKSVLVETFRELYRDSLKFETNRAIVFDFNQKIPTAELQHCIGLALTYHLVKHQPMLGA